MGQNQIGGVLYIQQQFPQVDIHQDDNTLYSIYIGGLVFKEAGKQPLTEKEKEDLTLWRESNGNRRQLFEQLHERSGVSGEIRSLNQKYNSDEAVKKIFSNLNLEKRFFKSKTSHFLLWRRKLSVAAAAIFLITGAWYFAVRPKKSKSLESSSGHFQKAIPPGGKKAILTLADGSTIMLDSTRDGQLEDQGSARLVKSGGKLSYHGDNKGGEIVYNIMSTPRGGQYQLVLPDGTKVWLNAASSVKYPTSFQGGGREVELAGEAYFEVAQHKSQPFTVRSGKMVVTVLGTNFDLMSYEDEENHRITLLEGKIKVGNGPGEKILEPGQQAIVNNGRPILIEKNADIDKAIAWKTGFFKFNNSDIRSLMREISRWYDIEVIYAITDFSGSYGGRISRNLNLTELVRLLEGNGIHHYRIEGRKLIVLP